jgi:hypothetical protein
VIQQGGRHTRTAPELYRAGFNRQDYRSRYGSQLMTGGKLQAYIPRVFAARRLIARFNLQARKASENFPPTLRNPVIKRYPQFILHLSIHNTIC